MTAIWCRFGAMRFGVAWRCDLVSCDLVWLGAAIVWRFGGDLVWLGVAIWWAAIW